MMRVVLGSALGVLVYFLSALLSAWLLYGSLEWAAGAVVGTGLMVLMIGFLSNDYGLAIWIAIGSVIFELSLVVLHQTEWVPWVGPVLPAGAVMYFSARLVENLGD